MPAPRTPAELADSAEKSVEHYEENPGHAHAALPHIVIDLYRCIAILARMAAESQKPTQH